MKSAARATPRSTPRSTPRAARRVNATSLAVLRAAPVGDLARAHRVMLRSDGLSAACVTGTTRPAVRRRIIEEFRAGRISVLCNHGVLTTGFDAPRVKSLVIARPTTSPVLYEQMVGRGMRGTKFGGTATCEIHDVVDNLVLLERKTRALADCDFEDTSLAQPPASHARGAHSVCAVASWGVAINLAATSAWPAPGRAAACRPSGPWTGCARRATAS